MGAYVTNKPGGIRSHPYTTDMTVNPLTYSDLETRNDSHLIGEVWASLLWEVYWSLVTSMDFQRICTTLNSLKAILLPCRLYWWNDAPAMQPTFLSARDAIVLLMLPTTRVPTQCEILEAFAKRGLGSKATSSYNNDFSVPSECR
ncbi:hypothetical protein BASA61_004488 [Batrachochytrium salamandrivorans]|nr:hypothetical protein BASA61_004488 [Batrachochytrium salamandrivorans]